MTQLESLIYESLNELSPRTKTGQNISKIRNFLDSSGEIVESVNQLGDTLNSNLKDSVGGLTGKISGWVAGKVTKVVGGIGVGVVSGTLKTVATLIPNKGDLKNAGTDTKISQIVNTYTLPADKNQLFELLQFLFNNLQTDQAIFGEKTLDAMKKLHVKAYDHLCVVADKNEEIFKLAKNYAPKKKFGFF